MLAVGAVAIGLWLRSLLLAMSLLRIDLKRKRIPAIDPFKSSN